MGLCVEKQKYGRATEDVKDFLESAWRERMRKIESRGPFTDRDGEGQIELSGMKVYGLTLPFIRLMDVSEGKVSSPVTTAS